MKGLTPRSVRRIASAGLAAPVLVGLSALVISAGIAGAAIGDALDGHGDARRLTGDQSTAIKRAIDKGRARNVILLIGDGMGDSEITAARNYPYGAAGRFPGIDALPLTGQYTTYSLTKDGKPDYDPESAVHRRPPGRPGPRPTTAPSRSTSAATARTRCSSSPRPRGSRPATSPPRRSRTRPRPCRSRTSRRAPATARPPPRTTCPEAALENGGLGSITEQLHRHPRRRHPRRRRDHVQRDWPPPGRYEGKTLRQQAQERGYQIVTDAAGLAAVTPGRPAASRCSACSRPATCRCAGSAPRRPPSGGRAGPGARAPPTRPGRRPSRRWPR